MASGNTVTVYCRCKAYIWSARCYFNGVEIKTENIMHDGPRQAADVILAQASKMAGQKLSMRRTYPKQYEITLPEGVKV